MILKLLFLHKNKNIDIEELKNDFSSVFKIKNNEFFYRDINYKFDIVKAQESNNIVFSISTTKSGNNLENAILIEDIKNAVKKGEHRKNYRIITIYDDSSRYFCDKATVIISKFERVLRQFIYLTVIQAYEGKWVEKTISKEIEKSHKEKGINQKHYIENALEEFSFFDYINYLFNESEEWSNEEVIETCKVEIKKQNPNINRIKEILEKSVKRSLWDRLFYNYNIKLEKEDLEIIRLSRNKVMHNKDFSSSEFNSIKILLKKLTKALEKEIININEEKYKENTNVTAVYTSFRDALLNAIETSDIFNRLSENINNINLGLREVVLSENQKELISLRKYQEEIIKQHNQIIKNIINNYTSNYNFSSNISKIIANLGDISEILKNAKPKLNIPTNHINELIKNLGNSSEIYSKEILKNKGNNE
ncbi:hypothetical protein [uncultured Gemella sp.]|uniref:hypothetical protein n=1 Tax=uncultured Gemella sp. TaxID=254352 RepID=UPI0028D7AC21|nr:hypothetical protein [uncultured Gemella sp.]